MDSKTMKEALQRMRSRSLPMAEVELRDMLRKAETAAFVRAMQELARSLNPPGTRAPKQSHAR